MDGGREALEADAATGYIHVHYTATSTLSLYLVLRTRHTIKHETKQKVDYAFVVFVHFVSAP